MLRSIYNNAIDWEIFDGINPCINIPKFKEKSRERFSQSEEVPKFIDALNKETNEVFRDFFYVCLFTGARSGNVLEMNWSDVNFERCVWFIKETKNGDSQYIHLIPQVIEILKARFNQKQNEWVFPSRSSASGHIEEPKEAWKRIIERASIEDLRIHDLRRTLGSWQAATGANAYVIGKSLGHKSQEATAIYARLNIDPIRESVNKATDAMLATLIKK